MTRLVGAAVAVVALVVLATGCVVAVAQRVVPTVGASTVESCTSGRFVGGGSASVPVPVGGLELAVSTWDAYAGREHAVLSGQSHESVSVGGRTTPDLADGVARADWSGLWRWESPGTLVVAHAWPGSGPHSVSWSVCWALVPPPVTTTTSTVPSSTTTVPVPVPDVIRDTVPVVTSVPVPVPVPVLVPAPVAEPVQAQPAFTG